MAEIITKTVIGLKMQMLRTAVYKDWCELIKVKGVAKMLVYETLREKYGISNTAIWKYVNREKARAEKKQAEKELEIVN
jgi:hypothetical protein